MMATYICQQREDSTWFIIKFDPIFKSILVEYLVLDVS